MTRVIQATTREEGGGTTVSLLFKAGEQLLDPGDPSPPERQELTEEGEAAIISGFDAVPLRRPAVLEIRLSGAPDPGSLAPVPEAIRHHFRFVLSSHERETGIFLRERRVSLAFTVVNILIAILYVGILYRNEYLLSTLAGLVTAAVIVIMNWATIWGTYEYFIYDGLRRRHRKKLLEKIIGSGIRVIPA